MPDIPKKSRHLCHLKGLEINHSLADLLLICLGGFNQIVSLHSESSNQSSFLGPKSRLPRFVSLASKDGFNLSSSHPDISLSKMGNTITSFNKSPNG